MANKDTTDKDRSGFGAQWLWPAPTSVMTELSAAVLPVVRIHFVDAVRRYACSVASYRD
jgi:hypothetical protein